MISVTDPFLMTTSGFQTDFFVFVLNLLCFDVESACKADGGGRGGPASWTLPVVFGAG